MTVCDSYGAAVEVRRATVCPHDTAGERCACVYTFPWPHRGQVRRSSGAVLVGGVACGRGSARDSPNAR